MAVRTDEFAFGGLCQHGSLTKASQVADVIDFLVPSKVVPCHGGVVKEATAISARRAFFELVVPMDDFLPATALAGL
jgi:hypothetical protein